MELDPKWIRVSSILSMMPTLVEGKWKFPMQELNQEMLQRKADIGTAVHSAIAADLEGSFSPTGHDGYFSSYEKWKEITTPLPTHIEKRFYYEPMNLSGCVDVLVKKDELLTLVDFKTTVQPDHTKWPIQAAFYKFLAETSGLSVSPLVHFIQLDKEGNSPKVHEYEITKELTQMAISLYNLYIYLTKMQR